MPAAFPAAARPPLTLDSDDAAWFKLFSLLEKYGKPGMLEEAFAEPPGGAAAATIEVNNRQESNTTHDPEEDKNEKRAKIITKLVDVPWLDEEDLEKKVLPFLRANSETNTETHPGTPETNMMEVEEAAPETNMMVED